MFIGREKELKALELLYKTNQFEMAIIYGRRRVGKTTLIKEFCKNKKTIFFSALESTEAENLNVFSRAILETILPNVLAGSMYPNFNDAFLAVGELSKNERIVLVIDEYPYLAESGKSISSLLQNMIDHLFRETKLYIILCGSSMSFMENQVLGYKSPLYGRRTGQFKILPFDYLVSGKWHQKYNLEEKALIYGITGGIPLYLEQFREGNIDRNIIDKVFNENALLYEEPSTLLKQELREPQVYNAIITAIATGSSKLNQIAGKVGIETGGATRYIQNLMDLGIVKKERPITEKLGKKTIYSIKDPLFRFWHRFVPANMSAIASGHIENTYERAIKPHLSTYMGLIFEQMCQDYLLFYCKELPIDVGEIGKWWGNNKELKCQEEIDIILAAPEKDEALFAECKYRKEPVDVLVLEELKRKADLIKNFKQKYYCLFSKSGFTARLEEKAAKEKVMLINLEQMYKN